MEESFALGSIDWNDLGPTLLDLGVTYGLRVVAALGILIAVWVASGALSQMLVKMLRRTHADGTVATFASTLVRWSLRILGVLLCMGVFGVETTSVAAVIGGAGIGVGVALKGNLSNLASGLVLLAVRPFDEGDWISTADKSGLVARVGLLHTELDSFDNERHWIPNALLIEDAITNHEHHAYRRADLEVGVAYDTDLDKVMEVLQGVVDELSDPKAPKKGVVLGRGFGASSIDFKVGAWCPTPEYFAHCTRLLLAVKKAFDEAGITIPFPQRDLHIMEPRPVVTLVQDTERNAAK